MTKLEDALLERRTLVAQELRHHEENVAAEMRRLRRELEHIENTFALRLGLA